MTAQIRKMPIGIQDFEKLRRGGNVYVDKTMFIEQLLQTDAQYFLSRPRRFGKSLFLSTLKYYFLGRKDLFEGLYISEVEKTWAEYPVFHIEFVGETYKDIASLNQALESNLSVLEEKWGKESNEKTYPARFKGLIRRAADKTGKGVVVLVDEYDKPLLSTMHKPELNEECRDLLKGFYGVLKGEDENLRFAFLTGVTKFSKVSIFSDLNQLNDISMSEKYGEICGISETELEQEFQPDIKLLGEKQKMTYEETLAKLKKYYDGYHFSQEMEGMFNPFSLLNCFDKQKFDYYWFATGTPTFLAKMVRDMKIDLRTLENDISISANSIMDYRFENRDPVPVMYQSGYLTIKSYDNFFNEYMLGYPNEEVKYGFMNELLPEYLNGLPATEFDVRKFCRDLMSNNVEQFMQRLQAFFAAIPYDLENKTEKHYHTIFYLLFNLMGQFIRVEDHSAAGSADAVVEVPDRIYIFEFKLDDNGTADDALRQIETKNYAGKYQLSGKEIIKIGAVFDNEKRTVKEWKIK